MGYDDEDVAAVLRSGRPTTPFALPVARRPQINTHRYLQGIETRESHAHWWLILVFILILILCNYITTSCLYLNIYFTHFHGSLWQIQIPLFPHTFCTHTRKRLLVLVLLLL